MVAAQQQAAPAIMSAQASCGHNATIAYGSLVPILLQKSLMVSTINDSLALTRFVAEAGDDGAAQS